MAIGLSEEQAARPALQTIAAQVANNADRFEVPVHSATGRSSNRVPGSVCVEPD
jgi:hypothetical protein